MLVTGSVAAEEPAPREAGRPSKSREAPVALPIDELADLTSRVQVIVTLMARDSFLNEFQYHVSVKNQSAESIEADSLVLVLEHVTDLAGKDALERMEVVGQAGHTTQGKPYFQIPRTKSSRLAPYTESAPVVVSLRNVAYTVVFTPAFRVLGAVDKSDGRNFSLPALIRLLLRKGVLSQDELEDLVIR